MSRWDAAVLMEGRRLSEILLIFVQKALENGKRKVVRFAGFELDQERAELRGPDGAVIRLRRKSFDMLRLFVANAGRLLSKQDLIDAVWPSVHVSDDSLFQCIREIRTALGDERRQLIKLVSGRGYLFDAEVSDGQACSELKPEVTPAEIATRAEPNADAAPAAALQPTGHRFGFGLRPPTAIAIGAGLAAVIGISGAVAIFAPDFMFTRVPPTIAVMPMVGTGNDQQSTEMAASVTERLIDGLAKIEKIRVVAARPEATASSDGRAAARSGQADFAVSGEIQKGTRSWTLQARLSNLATGEVRWTTSVSVDVENADLSLQRTRLAAGLGHPLALRLNAMVNSGERSTAVGNELLAGKAKVAIEQAMASINRTTPERFQAAQAMLENTLAAEPDNVDLEAALAAHLLRGIQLVWYNPADVAATEQRAQSMLEHALQVKPSYLPVLEAYCRFLTATNRFVESLVACARVSSFDPWNGLALYNLGLAQMQLGRFEDALATFEQADQFNTPQVSRWTWMLGAGITCLLLDRNETAASWLERSIAITPGTGRSHAVLAAAYQRLGRTDDARAAMQKALELRPGSTAANIALPAKNASSVFLSRTQQIIQTQIEVGLPER